MINWLLQSNISDVDIHPLTIELSRLDINFKTTSYDGYEVGELEKYPYNSCVLCYGSIDFVRYIQRLYPWIPGVWCNFHSMKCSTYYSYFGEYLLNRQYAMMPLGDLYNRWEDLMTIVDKKSLFVRPDSGAKPFTGFVVSPDSKHKIQSLITTVGPETLVVTSLVRTIQSEFRFVVCDKRVVAGCRYLPTEQKETTPTSLRLARLIALHEWQPDLCYTIDIAEHNDKVYLLEINSFSSSGFYECDLSSIIENANKAAVDEWKEYYM